MVNEAATCGQRAMGDSVHGRIYFDWVGIYLFIFWPDLPGWAVAPRLGSLRTGTSQMRMQNEGPGG